MKKLLLGVSSGIACYKILELIPLLKKKYEVDIIMTRNATKLVPKDEFEQALGKKVFTETFREGFDYREYLKNPAIDHISLGQKVDLVVMAPATANVLGKMAHGIADDLMTTTILASTGQKLIVPSMNTCMWNNPIVRQNISILQKNGFRILEPDEGHLLCGVSGKGRLAEVQKIADEIDRLFAQQEQLKGKNVIVTCGAISEKIDNVRVITNLSSGKMGLRIAESCADRGANVTVIHGNIQENIQRSFAQVTHIKNTIELQEALEKALPEADIIFHVAAVPDFIPKVSQGKISSNNAQDLKLKLNKKIIQKVKKINPQVYLVGFKAEVDISESELLDKMKKVMASADADLVVGNDVKKSQTFGSEENEVILWDGKEVLKIEKCEKREIAEKLVALVKKKIS